jgi:alkanesulfonate monooxygenase SsuD/methylene tetrahydromethanopterin reductase-like flavin-dependent oxidoreductase (luciferase family)
MKFGLAFDCATLPDSDETPRERYQDVLDVLPDAEAMGYDSAFFTSHHVRRDAWCPSPVVALAAAAGVTDTMTLGTGILILPLYDPMKLAEDTAVLDNLSDGRFVLGVAPGYVSEEFAAHRVPREERVGRMEETLNFLETAWTEERFSFEGKYFDVPETLMTPKPVQDPHPPVWYGVSGPRMLERAARRGAVQMASPRHGMEEMREQFDTYREAAERFDFEIPEVPVMRNVMLAETEERAIELAKPGIEHVYQDLYGAKSAEGERTLRTDEGAEVTDASTAAFEAIRDRFIVGTPEQAVEQVERYRDELGMDHLLCWTHAPGVAREDARRSVELFAEDVMPHFA